MYAHKLLPINFSQRPLLTNNIWHFHNYASWKQKFWNALIDIIPLNTLKDFDHEFLSLEENLENHNINIDNFLNILIDKTGYTYILAAHATKTSSISSFYINGLQPQNHKNIEDEFKLIFLNNPDFPEITPAMINNAIDSAQKNIPLRKKRLYFDLNENFINTSDSEFLIYESEYLSILSIYLANNKHDFYKQYLKSLPNSKATCFICKIKILNISCFADIYYKACYLVIDEYINKEPQSNYFSGYAAIWTQSQIPPKNILGHYHPDTT